MNLGHKCVLNAPRTAGDMRVRVAELAAVVAPYHANCLNDYKQVMGNLIISV